jgi:hypothetical protein
MTELPEIMKPAADIHDAIAGDLSGFGGVLRCRGECGTDQPLSEGDIGGYLRHGWPKCCGHGMRWVTQRQLDEESAAIPGSG